MKPIPHTPFLQFDYVDASNVRCRSYCQTNEKGISYAFADFEGKECVRTGATVARFAESKAFFHEVAALVECSNLATILKEHDKRKPASVGPLVIRPIYA